MSCFCCAGKGTSNTHQKVPLVTVASELWAVAFRANFLVFWAHCMSKSLRASRLDAVQHRAIHGLNSATKLTLQLTEKQQLQAQRSALGHPSAGLLTIEEAAELLGIVGVKGTSSNGGAKGPQDALRALSASGAEAAARLLVFARVAWLSEELLIVELGEETKARQLYASTSASPPDYDAATSSVSALPVHATHLHACIECRRVANAYATEGGKPGATFNELVAACSAQSAEAVPLALQTYDVQSGPLRRCERHSRSRSSWSKRRSRQRPRKSTPSPTC